MRPKGLAVRGKARRGSCGSHQLRHPCSRADSQLASQLCVFRLSQLILCPECECVMHDRCDAHDRRDRHATVNRQVDDATHQLRSARLRQREGQGSEQRNIRSD